MFKLLLFELTYIINVKCPCLFHSIKYIFFVVPTGKVLLVFDFHHFTSPSAAAILQIYAPVQTLRGWNEHTAYLEQYHVRSQ